MYKERWRIRWREFSASVTALALLKAPAGIPLYLNALMPLVGFYHIVVFKKLRTIFIWPTLFCLVAAVSCIVNEVDAVVYMRVLQILLTMCFANMISFMEPERFLDRLIRSAALVFVVVAIYELFFGHLGSRSLDMFGPLAGPARGFLEQMRVPRLEGVYGEWNFSAAAVSLVFTFALIRRNNGWAAILFAVLLGFVSRGALIGAFVALGVFALYKWSPRVATFTAFCLVVAAVLFPLMVMLVDASIDDFTRGELAYASSRRYLHWVNFAAFGVDNPFFGVGYFQGVEYYSHADVEWEIGDYSFVGGNQYQEAHNLFLDVFGEIGIIGYALLAVFFVRTASFCLRRAPELAPLFATTAVVYSFLSGISDWGFWVAIGVALSVAHHKKRIRTSASKVELPRGGTRSLYVAN